MNKMQQSPFENIFNMIGGLSQGNENAVKHAFYNAFALLVLAASCAAVYVLFLILEPFFKPLFWALLVGSLLHPFKYRLSKQLKAWFDGLEKTDTSVLVGIAVIPVNLVNYASNTIGSQFKEHYKLIVGTAGAVLLLPWLYSSVPRAVPCLFWRCIHLFCLSVELFTVVFNSYVMFTVAIGYLISVHTMWTPERAGMFRRASALLWLCASGYVSGLAGAWHVYAFILLQMLAVAGFVVEVLSIHRELTETEPETSMITSINMALSNIRPVSHIASIDTQDTTKIDTVETPKGSDFTSPEISVTDSSTVTEKGDSDRRLRKMHTLSSIPVNQMQFQSFHTPLRAFRKSLNETDLKNTFRIDEGEDETALYFKLLFFGCTCVLIWKQMWILPVAFFFLAVHFVKNIGGFFNVWSTIEQHYDYLKSLVMDWWEKRSDAIVSAHVRGLLHLLATVNRSVRAVAYHSVDTVSSCIVITALILLAIIGAIFLAIQIYSEAVVVVQLAGSALNSSVVRDSALWGHLPDGWENSLDSLLDNAYTYGREGLSSVVRGALKEGDAEKVSRVEQQVLELWDRIYQSWMSGAFQSGHGPHVDSRAVSDSWDSFLTDITKTPGLLNYAGAVEWLRANVGTLTAIAGSVWAPLAANLSLLAGSLGALASVLLCGGSAILNFIFSLVVFFTTLFYLLAASGSLYIPVELITQTQPSFGPRLGLALSVAINQVFRASFKMALFYGLWTWLVHNLFGAKVVYLPSVLAAVLGAAPFLGTWLACAPAALDVWLAQGRPLAALALALAQAAPVSFVDAAIYKEIRNGGHPYLTGLAIAGGIFFFGAEGAILGPLLLCCLLVVFNLSSAFMREIPADERAAAALQSRIRFGGLM